MGWISVYSVLSTIERWLTGYRAEHLQLGLQQGICQALALLPVLVQQLFRAVDRGGSALFIAVTVAVVLEPSTGDAFRKLVLRVAAAGASGGVGILFLFFAVGNNSYSYNEYHKKLAAWIVPTVAVLSFVLATNQQRYWRHREFWTVALLTLPIVIVPAVRSPDGTFYSGACYRMLDIVIGIVLAAVVSFCVFPVRASMLLEKKMASTLMRLGDQAAWLVGQACAPPAPGTSSMLGATGTDEQCLYTDDGLRARLAPLMTTTNELAADVSSMWQLLEAAGAEIRITKPHRFPTHTYMNLLHSCHVSMGIFYALLNSMQSGDLSLEVCGRHVSAISEAGFRLSAGFTALGSLIRPPKAKKKKKGKKQGTVRAEGRNGGANGGGAGDASHGGGAQQGPQQQQSHALQLQQQQQQQQQQGQVAKGEGGSPQQQQGFVQPAPAVPDVEAPRCLPASGCDDPFADFEDETAAAAGASPAPVVALSDSQLQSAQQLARHLSLVMSRHSDRGAAAGGSNGGGGGASGKRLASLDEAGPGPGAAEPSLNGLPEGSAAAEEDAVVKPSVASSLSMPLVHTSSVAQRRDWVLAKLRALVDSTQQLEAAAVRERAASVGSAGISSFLLIAHSLINLTRQCCACLTALDPERGAELHKYFREARQAAYLRM